MSSRPRAGKRSEASKATSSPSPAKKSRVATSKKRRSEDDDEFERSQPEKKKILPFGSQDSSVSTTQASSSSSFMSPTRTTPKRAKKSQTAPIIIDLDSDDLNSPMDVSVPDDWSRSTATTSTTDISTSLFTPSQKETTKKAGMGTLMSGGLIPTSRAVSSLFSAQAGLLSRNEGQSTSSSPKFEEAKRHTIAKPPSIQMSSYLASSHLSSAISPSKQKITEPSLPWCDKYTPTTTEALAIHPPKLTALVELLSSMLRTFQLNQTHQFEHVIPGTRVLILTGPTGTGKSTAIRLLLGKGLINELLPLENFNVELVEYVTPVEYSNRSLDDVELDMAKNTNSAPPNASWSTTYESKLKPFLQQLQTQKYPPLAISGVDTMMQNVQISPMTSTPAATASNPKIKVLLVDDMPYLHDWRQKTEFQRAIKGILNSRDYNPIIFILSHSQASDTSTPWQLFSREILEHSSVKLLEFLPVNNRLLQKTLNGILKQENLSIEKEDLLALVETCGGDVRSAVNSLQWMVEQNRFSPSSKRSKATSVKTNFPQTEMMKKLNAKSGSSGTGQSTYTRVKIFSSLSRDISLSLFHSLGKVLYAKRLKEGDIDDIGNEVHELRDHPTIPSSSLLYRPPLKSSPEMIHEVNIEASGSLLMHYLLENYVKFFGTLEDVISASDYLSYADTYSSGPYRESSIIREYSDLVAMRGVMFSNSKPKEWSFTKLVKPTSLQAQRTIRDNTELLDLIYESPNLDFDIRSMPQRATKMKMDQEYDILGRGELPAHRTSFLGREAITCDWMPYHGLIMRETNRNRVLATKYSGLLLPAERNFVELMVRYPPTHFSAGGGGSVGVAAHGRSTSVLGEQASIADADEYESEVNERDRKQIIITNIMKERRSPLQLGGASGAFSSTSKTYSAYSRSANIHTSSNQTHQPTTILGRGPPLNPANATFLPQPTTFALPALPVTMEDDIIDDDSWTIKKP